MVCAIKSKAKSCSSFMHRHRHAYACMHAIARFLTCHRDVGIPKTALGRARVVYGSASGERAFATGMLSVLLSTGKKERALYNLYVIYFLLATIVVIKPSLTRWCLSKPVPLHQFQNYSSFRWRRPYLLRHYHWRQNRTPCPRPISYQVEQRRK